MKLLSLRLKPGISVIVALILFTTIATFSPFVRMDAFAQGGPKTKGDHRLEKGPATLVKKTTQLLHRPVNPPRQITHQTLTQPKTTTPRVFQAVCTSPTIDLKILVIAADGNEPDLPAIQQTLDYLGTPYTVYKAAQTPGGLTSDKLANGCHSFYQGVILTSSELAYLNNSNYVSALSQDEWTNLWTYQAQLGVRVLSWYTYPTADYGFQALSGVADTTSTPLNAQLTTAGQPVFSYVNKNNPVAIRYAYTYQANALADGTTTPLITDPAGHALALVHKTADGRETMALTFDSNPYLFHSVVFSYGLVNWLTKGLFLGERHTYMSAQIDDLFIDDSDWLATTPCGTAVDNTGATIRISGTDLMHVLAWQTSQRTKAVSPNFTLTMAYNGYGTTNGAYANDTLTPVARLIQGQFNWVSHTYDHENLDAIDYAGANAEITQNNQVATNMRFTHFNKSNMVTPDVSGLTNPNFLKAAFDNGIRYLVSDTSRAGYNNPSPNAGIYNSIQPSILMLPRYPNNLFYNVSTPQGWTAEYNCIYNGFWGRNLTYQEILDFESDVLVTYMLKGNLNPWMFHQPNLRAYDGQHTLLGDLLDKVMQKYQNFYNLPVVFPTMDQLGQTVANRMQYNQAGVTASITGSSITITAQKAARVPVTGLNTTGSETYGGQHISYINLNAGQSVTLPLK